MLTPKNDSDPSLSALKDGIVIGVLASLREFGIETTYSNVRRVLIAQQEWDGAEVDYYLKFFGLIEHGSR